MIWIFKYAPKRKEYAAMSETALLIVDMVKDFTDANGLVFYPQNREILPKIKEVLDKCREKGVLIVFLQHCNRKVNLTEKQHPCAPTALKAAEERKLIRCWK